MDGDHKLTFSIFALDGLNTYLLASLPLSFITLVGYAAMSKFESRWEQKADNEAVALENGRGSYESATMRKRRHALKRQREAWYIVVLVVACSVALIWMKVFL